MANEISRRQTLGLMGAAGIAASGLGLAAPTAQAAPAAIDLDDEKELTLAFRKLAYSLDEKMYFWWMRGTRYGVVDAEATPFWDMYVGTWFKTRDREDGNYEVIMGAANFYTPPGETTLLETFSNPYTGRDVKLNYKEPKPWTTVMAPGVGSAFAPAMPNMKTTSGNAAGPGWIEGEDVAIRGDMFMYAEPLDAQAGPPPFRVNDWSTYVGKLSELADPALKSAPCVQYFTDILTWPQWLEMGAQPGSYVSRCFGRKVADYAQMPATWRKLFEAAFPAVAKDPASILGGG